MDEQYVIQILSKRNMGKYSQYLAKYNCKENHKRWKGIIILAKSAIEQDHKIIINSYHYNNKITKYIKPKWEKLKREINK